MKDKIELKLKFNNTQIRIMKQRKKIYMKKNKFKELSWKEYFWYIVLLFGDKKN